MATPVFVIGKQRSGTTWLGNLIGEHPEVAGIRDASHHGIRESRYFSIFYGRYGDLRKKPNFMEFVQVITKSDYFQLAGATREFLCSMNNRQYEDIFRLVMDRYAEERGKNFWVEKTPMHALWIDKIAQSYPDAKFVAIKRNPEAVVASSLRRGYHNNTKSRQLRIAQIVQDWTYYEKLIGRFARRSSDRIIRVSYEDLVSNTRGELTRICEFIGIQYTSKMHDQPFVPNTSFSTAEDRDKGLTSREKQFIRQMALTTKLLPLSALNQAELLRRRLKGRDSLPETLFSMFLRGEVVSSPKGISNETSALARAKAD